MSRIVTCQQITEVRVSIDAWPAGVGWAQVLLARPNGGEWLLRDDDKIRVVCDTAWDIDHDESGHTKIDTEKGTVAWTCRYCDEDNVAPIPEDVPEDFEEDIPMEKFEQLAARPSPFTPPPTHLRAGTNSERQSVGLPGHCEQCAEHGHVAAHPSLGCGDVGCNAPHGDEDDKEA